MKLSIIPSDGTVCENGVCYTKLTWDGTPPDVHALQWDTDSGWIELKDGSPNEPITELPDWAISAEAAWDVANQPPPPPPPPTPEEIQAQNKAQAESLLQATDWTATIDIADPAYSDPYLSNQTEFLQYRSEVRKIAVNPPTTPVDPWPTPPAEEWSSV